ncbi:O-antigen ligase family protein [Halomonas mongoliensis]|uniref:O-antigen ligase family protein n=1 Tax=Halomonas mongoliensis TaxID=321265 RepID=UPI00403B1574
MNKAGLSEIISGSALMNIAKPRFFIFWLSVVCFLFLPFHTQYLVSDAHWEYFRAGLFFLLFAFYVLFVLYKGKVLIGADGLFFYIIIAFLFIYYASGRNLFLPVLMAFIFYFLGKNSKLFLDIESIVNVAIYSARVSIFYFIYLLFFSGESALFLVEINPNSFSLHVALAFSILLFSYSINRNAYDLLGGFFLVFILLYVGSRGGALLVFAFVLFFLFSVSAKRLSLFFFILTALVVYLIFNYTQVFVDFRIYNQYVAYFSGADIDLTTGRHEGYVLALSLLSDGLFFGVGDLNLREYGLGYTQVHNFYIRVLVEYGLFAFILFLFLFSCIFLRLYSVRGRYKLLGNFLIVILFVPLLYEPNGLFGNFKITGVAWFLMGALSSFGNAEWKSSEPPAVKLSSVDNY